MTSTDDIQVAKAAALAAAESAANLKTDHQIESRYSTARQVKYATQDDPLPAGAVRLSERHVAEVTNKTVQTWTPSREMWSVKHGAQALGGMAGVTGLLFISHFRSSMLLRQHARFASLIPTVFFPSVVTATAQMFLVVNPMVSGQINCPVCLQMRSLSIQTLGGVVQPFILSIIAASAIARSANTFALPPVSDWRALLATYARMTRPIHNTALYVLMLSAGGAAIMTAVQGRAVNKVHQYLIDHDVFIT